jgi:hypothetical protein
VWKYFPDVGSQRVEEIVNACERSDFSIRDLCGSRRQDLADINQEVLNHANCRT